MYRKTLSFPRARLSTALLGTAVLVLLGMVGVSYREWRQYNRANADAARTREILDSVDTFLSSLFDAEAGQRGFLLTGEERFLGRYDLAVKALPNELTQLRESLAALPAEASNITRLDGLVDQKLHEIRRTVELRRTQGAQAALAFFLSAQDKRLTHEIRAVAADIKQRESSGQNQAFIEGEAAAQTALLVMVAGALVLMFLFAVGLEPFQSAERPSTERSESVRYGAAVLAVLASFLLRRALTPVIGPTTVPFSLFYPAVLFAASFGGLRVGALSVALSALAANYYFAEPTRSLVIGNRHDQVELLIFVLAGFGMALLGHSQRAAVARSEHAENAERIERQRFETTLASIGDAVIATDEKGTITFVNKVARRLLRASEADLLGQHLDAVFHIVNEFTHAPVESPVAKVLREGRVVGMANHTILMARDGTPISIDDSAAPMLNPRDEMIGVVLVFRDIGDKRAMEEKLRSRAEELAILVDATPALVWFAHDPDCKRVTGNQTANALLGVAPGANVSQTPGDGESIRLRHFKPDGTEMPTHELPLQRAAATGEAVNNIELEFCLNGGRRIHLFGNAAPLFDANGKVRGAVSALLDVSARKRAEAVLRQIELAAELLRAQDEERRRIGRDLHDGAGQNLVMLKMRLDSMQSSTVPAEAVPQKLAECIRLADDIIKEIRTTSYALYPPMLDESGLKSAIPWFLDGFMERTGITTQFQIPGDFARPPRDMELALFRVLQEALTNVLKHSGSTVAEVRLATNNGMVRFEVVDHGKGIPREVLDAYNANSFGRLGVGLRGMKERIRQLDGRLEVSSSAGETIVSALVPWAKSS